jgi:hypothetical protein
MIVSALSSHPHPEGDPGETPTRAGPRAFAASEDLCAAESDNRHKTTRWSVVGTHENIFELCVHHMTVDISALMSSLQYWELAGYGTLIAVAIGVAGETIHDLTGWFKSFPWWKAKGGAALVLLLTAALAAEVVTQVKTTKLANR